MICSATGGAAQGALTRERGMILLKAAHPPAGATTLIINRLAGLDYPL